MKQVFCLLSLLMVLSACTKETGSLNNEDLVFTNSYPIGVDPYTYTDPVNHTDFTVYGDSIWRKPDTVSSRPVLAWTKHAPSILLAAIFKEPIRVEGGEIVNTQSIVWQWHSGMPTVYQDTVYYSEGKAVSNGIELDGTPVPLDTGLYYWAVWGWGKTGVYIYYSSKQYGLYVEN